MKSIRALGYTAIFLPPTLLAVGDALQFYLLLPLCFFVVFPILRLAAGSVLPGENADWSDSERKLLDSLPRIYALLFVVTMAWVLFVVGFQRPHSFSERTQFVVATLVLGGLAECVAHDLGHRRGTWDRRAAHLISAVAGYPFFIFEHWAHHAHARDTMSAHCPHVTENVWAYAVRRAWMAPMRAVRLNANLARNGGNHSILDDLRFYVAMTAVLWGAFALVGSLYGFCLYAVLIVGVPFLLNTITYIQHWGLGDDSPAAKLDGVSQVGWDDTARFQSWLILGISFHHQHHQDAGRPYYTYGPTVGAPALPAEYAILVPLCFAPPLWRRVMKPVLLAWASSDTGANYRSGPDAPSA